MVKAPSNKVNFVDFNNARKHIQIQDLTKCNEFLVLHFKFSLSFVRNTVFVIGIQKVMRVSN